MKRTILKNVGIGLCFLLSTGTVCAQNYPGKVKNAQGIEVTYQSNYKGKARPGHLLMTVSGDRVSLTNVWPEQNDCPNPRPEDKTPVTGSYIDYTTRQAYRRAELPNGQVISAVTPFEFGKGFTQTGEGKHLGMNCKICAHPSIPTPSRCGIPTTSLFVVLRKPMWVYLTDWY